VSLWTVTPAVRASSGAASQLKIDVMMTSDSILAPRTYWYRSRHPTVSISAIYITYYYFL